MNQVDSIFNGFQGAVPHCNHKKDSKDNLVIYTYVDVGKSRNRRKTEVVSMMRLRTRREKLPTSNLTLAGLNRFRPHYFRIQQKENEK